MKFTTWMVGLLAIISAPMAFASYVSYTSTGLQVVVTLAIPAAYTLISDAPANVDTLARLALGDVYDITSEYWMFPPNNFFQYASTAAQNYVTVGAGLDFSNSGGSVTFADIQNMAAAISYQFNIPNIGQTSKRDVESFITHEIFKRDGNCYYADGLPNYITEDDQQTMDTQGSCVPS